MYTPRTISLTQVGSANTSRINSGGPSGRRCSIVRSYAKKQMLAQSMRGTNMLLIGGFTPLSERREALISASHGKFGCERTVDRN